MRASTRTPWTARLYDPSLGRWLTPDPMGGDITNPQSLNRYAYVMNNPTTLTDPEGLFVSVPVGCTYMTDSSGEGNVDCPAPPEEGARDSGGGEEGGDTLIAQSGFTLTEVRHGNQVFDYFCIS